MQFMVCMVHSCGPAATTIEMEDGTAYQLETCTGCYKNKIQERTSRWFYYRTPCIHLSCRAAGSDGQLSDKTKTPYTLI